MTQLTPLSSSSLEYMSLYSSFKSHFPDWNITIYSIIKINMPEHIVKKHQEFKQNQDVNTSALQLYHGTKHSCNIKELNNIDMLCKNFECCTCGIIRNGPQLSLAKTRDLGTPTANISHEYTGVIPPQNQTTSKYTNCCAVFLMDVVAPEPFNDVYFVRSEEIDEKDTRIEVSTRNDVSRTQEKQPSLEELATLEKVPDRMPKAVFLICICEFCERFAYWGATGPFQNYIEFPVPKEKDGQPGVIGAGQQTATTLNLFFHFFCFALPALGAIIADQYLGRYKTILIFSLVYITGLIILTLTAIPPAIEAKASLPGLIVSMIIIGIGTGGIKTNCVTMAADQFPRKDPYVKTLKSGKKVIVDPGLTISSMFHWFFLSLSFGSLSPLITTYIEKYHSFWLAFLIPTIMFLISVIVFVSGNDLYVKIQPNSSALLDLFNVFRLAFKHGRNLDNAKPSKFSLDAAKQYKIKWDDKFVDQIRATIKAYRVILTYPIYWVCYMQVYNNLISQAATMTVKFIPNDMMYNLNPITLMIFTPIANHIFYPALRRIGINSHPVTRISIGFIIIASAMLYSAIVQYIIYNTGPCFEETRCIIDGKPVPNDISIWWQAPSYILVAFSEILVCITGLNYVYDKAPLQLKSTITALYLTTLAAGSLLGFVFVPLSKDPYLVWQYSILAAISSITGIFLFIFFRDSDGVCKEEVI
ncbi:11691_t:CDS:2 [Dentiscutata erythropus]|uniref:11691_t:CDS:1 n=1 Tax=Dentiscutata erythropus TaxID=1348616 RepID=A0A9N8Z0P5_9GLOM|nr:11691_t:CDS:2 [Dentiscutata erythropus]